MNKGNYLNAIKAMDSVESILTPSHNCNESLSKLRSV